MQRKTRVALFGNVRVLCFAAMLTAMSVVLAYLAKLIFGTGPLRLTFENLPIVFAGLSFGPFIGGAVGLAADLCSCLLAGQAPLPLITVAATLVGVFAGCFGLFLKNRKFLTLLFAELSVQTVCSMFLKSLALYLVGFPVVELLPRIGVYLGVSLAEAFLLFVLYGNRQIKSLLERMCEK